MTKEKKQTDPRFYQLRALVLTDKAAALKLVKEDPGIIEARNSIGETVLHFLVIESEIKAIEWLLAQGADINTRNDFEQTPLIDAASVNAVETCLFLLNNGADILARDHNGETAISAAAQSTTAEKGELVLLNALLERAGDADIHDFFDDLSAYMLFNYGNPTVIELLRSRGLSFDWTDD